MRNNNTSNTKKNNMIELVNRKSAKKKVADTDEDCQVMQTSKFKDNDVQFLRQDSG